MSCVRESSPQPDRVANQRPEPKRRRFNPLRGLRRIFRRKTPSPERCIETVYSPDVIEPHEPSKSRSTTQLIEKTFRRRSSHISTLQQSVSHDSVFNPEHNSGQSDSESAVSVPRLGFPQANIQEELKKAISRRKKLRDDEDSDDVDEGLGLPRSPSMHSPIIATGNDPLNKDLITKSSHSTCSDGSLLSMGSSEMDEDSFGPQNSRHSSKISLHEKSHLDSSDGDFSMGVPLSHSAAKHRIAIRPKRKHGNPRSKKPLAVTNALPATPEVNEEHSGRSASPETKPQTVDTADGTTVSTTISTTIANTSTTSIANNITTITTAEVITDTYTAATVGPSCDLDTSVDEISVENVPQREEGFFHRLLSRHSSKKKTGTKASLSEDVDVDRFLFDENMGAKPRQREEPPPAGRMQVSYPPDLPPDHHHSNVPIATPPLAENIFESDTFTPIKQSFSLGQQTTLTDDDATSSGDGSSVQKSSSSDSVSSAALDELNVDIVTLTTTEWCRSYSSSDSDHQRLPVPAPRLSKLHNGGITDEVVRRKKRDDQQPELLKVFARRSLKLGKDGEPELLLLVGDSGNEVDDKDKEMYNKSVEDIVDTLENEVTVVVVEKIQQPEVDVNKNQSVVEEVVQPRFKRIQQRREEWEKRLLQQQRN